MSKPADIRGSKAAASKAVSVVLVGLFALGFQAAAPPVRFQVRKLAAGIDAASAGLAPLDSGFIVWSKTGVKVFRQGLAKPVKCGLDGLRDVISISPGDFNNDGLIDLAILTQSDAELWINKGETFERANVFIPEGAYNKAIWIDFDHDTRMDLLLLGDKSALLRNNGAGFTNVSNNFPLVAGRAVDGAVLGKDLFVIFSDRPGVLYEDKLGGRFEAQDLDVIPAGAKAIVAANPDLLLTTTSGTFPVFRRADSFEKGPQLTSSSVAPAVDDFIAVPGTIMRNEGSGKFDEIKVPDTVDAAALTALDFDQDGRTDLIEVRRDGSLIFLRNETAR